MTFLIMIIILGIMVIVHEAGHFIPAKLFKMEVPIFSIGYGKRLIGKKIKGTDYRISLIPFGGYVKLKGMDPDEMNETENAFLRKPVWQRIIVIFSGPFSNLILAFFIFLIIIKFFGITYIDNTHLREVKGEAQQYLQVDDSIMSVNGKNIEYFTDIFTHMNFGEDNEFIIKRNNEIITEKFKITNPDSFLIYPIIKPIIGDVVNNSPAYKAGLKKDDIIISIDNNNIKSWDDVSQFIKNKYEQNVQVSVLRNSDTLSFNIIPDKYEIMDGDSTIFVGKIGIMFIAKTVKPNLYNSIKYSFERIKFVSVSIVKFLKLLITGKMSAKNVGGPISIYTMVGENMKWGFDALLGFMAFFSLNLFIFNLIPFPPLDGSFILLYIVEGIFKIKANRKFMLIYQQIGFFILMLLILLVSYNDIMRLINK